MARSPGRYGLLAGLVVLAASTSWLAASARGKARNAAYAAIGQNEADTERARLAALRFPPAVGTAREATCAFDDVSVAFLDTPAWRDVNGAALHPERPLTPEVEATVRNARRELDAVSAALPCDRVDPAVVSSMQLPAWTPLAGALLVDGHVALRDAEVERATTRYLEAALVCAHAGASAPSNAWPYCKPVFLALARLLATVDAAPLERVDGFLTALEPTLPSNAAFARHFRLRLAEAAEHAEHETTVPLSAPKYWNIVGQRHTQMRAYSMFVPQAFRYAQAMDQLDGLYRHIETLPQARSPERAILAREIEDQGNSTTNLFVYDLADGAILALDEGELGGLAAYRLARTVATIERSRRSLTSVLAVLPEAPYTRDPETLGDALHYELDAGYRLWSVGKDGLDQHGAGDDLLIERASLRARSL